MNSRYKLSYDQQYEIWYFALHKYINNTLISIINSDLWNHYNFHIDHPIRKTIEAKIAKCISIDFFEFQPPFTSLKYLLNKRY
jgi:hypothetical protein